MSVPLFEHFCMTVLKEFVTIGPEIVKEGSSLELHERLIVAVSFTLNGSLMLRKSESDGIHMIGH
jgi:alcohol dehydrogenase YqhD (iron-dependent ADH family)